MKRSQDERIEAWKQAIKDRAALAEENFAQGLPPTGDDMVAVALAHPESYEILINLKGR